MKVSDLRETLEDCWFLIGRRTLDNEDVKILFNQSQNSIEGKSTLIPNELLNQEISWACVDSPDARGDTVIYVEII